MTDDWVRPLAERFGLCPFARPDLLLFVLRPAHELTIPVLAELFGWLTLCPWNPCFRRICYFPSGTGLLLKPATQGVTEQERKEFLKVIRKSEYTVVEQLNRMPAQISILGLLIPSLSPIGSLSLWYSSSFDRTIFTSTKWCCRKTHNP